MRQLKEKVAFITGGTKGIGYGIAQSLLAEGIHVIITSRSQSDAEAAAQRLSELEESLGKAIGVKADVKQLSDVETAVKKAHDSFGAIDIVIANAGVGHFASIEDLEPKQWHDVIDTNLTGVFNTVKATVNDLKSQKGYFMSISSLAGANFFATGAAYNASKFGVTGFTQAVMLDLRQHGVKVTTIMPGSVSTHFNNNTPSDKGSWKIQIEDLGELVVDLLKMHPRTLPSKVEVRPSQPPSK